jgi:putative hydroxymethylpyrimidine transport system ATP-binding protein
MVSPSVILKNVDLRFQNQFLFQNLNFTLAAGTMTCLLGRSGLGKSSLLRLIAGLTKPSNKDACIEACYSENKPPHDDSTGRLPRHCTPRNDGKTLATQVSYLFQEDALLPWLSILDNVMLGARLRKTVSKETCAKALELLERVGLSQHLNKKIYKLSGGMRQRVALARTLLEDRPIVLMDEPFANLDIYTRHQLQNLSAELLKSKTVLLVTHDPLEALRLGQHLYLMSGSPASISAPITLNSTVPRDIQEPAAQIIHAKLVRSIIEDTPYEH